MTKCVWITGCSGFTGLHMIDYLRNSSQDVSLVGIDRKELQPDNLDFFFDGDVCDQSGLEDIARKVPPDYVIHLAALMPPAPDAKIWQVNVCGGVALINALRTSTCKRIRVLNIGSAAEYAANQPMPVSENGVVAPKSVYGLAKLAQSSTMLQLAGQSNTEVVVARTFNLVGPRLPTTLVAGALCEQFCKRESEVVSVGDIHSERDFIDIRDAVRAYWLILSKGDRSRTYNVCTGVGTAIEKLVGLFTDNCGREVCIKHRQLPEGYRSTCIVGSNELLCQSLGWSPTIDLTSSVRDMLRSCE